MPRKNRNGREEPQPRPGPRRVASIYPPVDHDQRVRELVDALRAQHGIYDSPTPEWILREARTRAANEKPQPRYGVIGAGARPTSARERRSQRTNSKRGNQVKKQATKQGGQPPNKKPTKGRRHH